MKKVVKLLSILFLVSGLFFVVSCGDKKTKVDNPTNLSVSDVTEFSAKFTWSGTADSYEIMLGSQTFTVTTTAYSATDLTEGTKYAWKVRAKKGSDYSDWVDGTEFTTKIVPDGFSVVFGSATWASVSASYSNTTNGIYVVVLGPGATQTNPFPLIWFTSSSSGTTTYLEESGNYYFEYAENTFLSDDEELYGDWWAKSGSVTITSNSGGKVSGNAELVMYNAKQKYHDGNTNPETRNLTVTFKNVNLATTSSTQKSMDLKKQVPSNIKLIKK